jgi:hypothetical protein
VFPSMNLTIKIYEIIILPAALYMHGTSSLESVQHRLTMFCEKVLRRIFGLKGAEVTRECCRIRKEVLHNLSFH